MTTTHRTKAFLDRAELATVVLLFVGSLAVNLVLWVGWGRMLPAFPLLVLIPLLISAVLIVGGRRRGHSKTPRR